MTDTEWLTNGNLRFVGAGGGGEIFTQDEMTRAYSEHRSEGFDWEAYHVSLSTYVGVMGQPGSDQAIEVWEKHGELCLVSDKWAVQFTGMRSQDKW